MIHLIFILFLFVPTMCLADWQGTLEEHFDMVETFDQLQDWHGVEEEYVYNQDDMPKKMDGSPSIWQTYYGWNDEERLDVDWIKDFGPGNTWYSGKSIRITQGPLQCYQSHSVRGEGCPKIGTYFGTGTGDSGYQDFYLFVMMKYNPLYWLKKLDGTYEYPPTNKLIDFITGFKNINEFDGPTCQENQQEYGTANWLFNNDRYSDSLFFMEADFHTKDNGSCYAYESHIYGAHRDTLTYTEEYEDERWFGVEYHYNLGTLNNADASVDIWIYNDEGDVIGEYHDTGRAKLRVLDYRINKFILGANYQCLKPYHWSRIKDTTKYYDDLIFNGTRIGPTYFSLLFGNGPSRSSTTPGVLPYDATNYDITITTDTPSTCKYDIVSDITYDNINNTFTTTGGTEHITNISGLSMGYDRNFYIKCFDGTTKNDKDFIVRLNIPSEKYWYDITDQTECTSTSNTWCTAGNYCYDTICCEDDVTYCYNSTDCGTLNPDGNWCNEPAPIYSICRPPEKNCGDPFDAHEMQSPSNCINNGFTWDEENLICVENDLGPVRTTVSPIGEQPVDTTEVTLEISTDVNATCTYGNDGESEGTYPLEHSMSGDGTMSHTATITGLVNGGSYLRNVMCSDGTEANDTPHNVTWTVADDIPGGCVNCVYLDGPGRVDLN